jgi:hypothetical protein
MINALNELQGELGMPFEKFKERFEFPHLCPLVIPRLTSTCSPFCTGVTFRSSVVSLVSRDEAWRALGLCSAVAAAPLTEVI